MIFIYDRNENQIATLNEVYKFTREIGKFNTLEFETDIDIEKGYRAVIIREGKAFEFIVIDSEYTRDDVKRYSYYCQDSLTEIQGNIILDKRPEGNFEQALNVVLEGTRWTLRVEPDYNQSVIFKNSFYRISSLEAFTKVVEQYNIEWRTEFGYTGENITSRTLVIDKLGVKTNGRLEFGKNIKQFKRKILPDPIITALYGFGKGEETDAGGYGRRIDFADINNGQMYVENLAAKEEYGIGLSGSKVHNYGVMIFEEITDKSILLEETKKQLEIVSQIQAEYTVDAVNLFIVCHYGDEVPVIDDEINFRSYARIIKEVITSDGEKIDTVEFTFGNITRAFTDTINKEIAKVSEQVKNEVSSIYNTVISQITQDFMNEDAFEYRLKADNEYGLPAGTYSFDAPIDQNPTKVIYFGAGKILIADSKASDGSWNWQTALTGAGLVGSSIIAHSITANQLASDIGQSLDLSSNTSITLTVKDEVDDYLTNNPIEVKTEKPFYAYADIDGTISNFSTSWTNQKYQGVYVGYERPTDPNMYEWVRIQGIDGENGNDGVGLEGEPVIKYGKSDDENTLPIEWFDSPIMVEGGLISWTRTILTYTDGTVTNIDTPLKVPLDGEQGQDGRGIIELQTMYGLSDSKDVEPTEWFAIPLEIKGGDFSWTRIELIFNDGTTEFVKTVTQNADILEVREDGYLYVNGVKTDKKVQGENGYTPYVQDGYWYINGINTGQKAVGEDGKDASILYRFSNDKTTMSLVDNSHRYVGLYRGTGDVNLASSYVWLDRLDLKVLEDRIKTNAADIAVNKTNITSKVSQTTYTADQTKINDQLSTITQDMESWEAKFESIGGTNLLKGSKYLTEWQSVENANVTETYSNVVTEWDTIMATAVNTGTGDKTTARKAVKRFIVPTDIIGRLLTFSMYVKNTRTTATETVEVDGALIGTSEVINPGETKRIVIQGYANDLGYIDVYLVAQGVGYLFEGLVFKALLELGNQINDWTPHPDEIESGSTRISEEGLIVGKSSSDVQTSIMDNGLFIQDTISGEPIAEFTRDGANTSILTATDIYSDSIIRRQRNSVDVYVGPSMTGDGSGRDSSNRLDNINRAIDVGLNYAYHLTDYATINIYLKGTINEIVMITGVNGYGKINIIGESGSRLVGAIFVNSCTAEVDIRDLNISLDAPDTTNACVNFHNSTCGKVIGCTLVGQNVGRGLNVTMSNVAIEGTQFFDLTNGVIATDLGRVMMRNCKGECLSRVGIATYGGFIGADGTRPSVPVATAIIQGNAGTAIDNKTTSASGIRPSFAPPTFGNVTKTFYADLATANSNGYEWLKGEARQGTWDRKVNIGIAKFGSKIKDWLAANGGYQGTVTAVVTAKRNRSSGGGTVSFKITNPATLTLPAVSRGGSSSATAGTSLTNSITTSSNLVLKTSTTNSSDYAGYTSVSIKITTMKKV